MNKLISEVKLSSSLFSESSQVLFQEVVSNEKMKSSCQVKEVKSESMIRSRVNKSREVPKSKTEVVRSENEFVVKPNQVKIRTRQESASELCGCRKQVNRIITFNKISLFEHVSASGEYNFRGCRIPLPGSKLNISRWREKLERYSDKVVCDFLQYGFPLDVDKSTKLSYNERRNHKGARDYPQFIDRYLEKECQANRIAGPFNVNPLSKPLMVSPINTVPKASLDERRVIVDLS